MIFPQFPICTAEYCDIFRCSYSTQRSMHRQGKHYCKINFIITGLKRKSKIKFIIMNRIKFKKEKKM